MDAPEVLRLPDKRFLSTNNGQSIATLPIDPEKDRLSALTTGIQPDKNGSGSPDLQ
ncbi:MAG: hypothetical protein V8T87_13155 [Victivallales bacterium]